jgi:hypothetical protein
MVPLGMAQSAISQIRLPPTGKDAAKKIQKWSRNHRPLLPQVASRGAADELFVTSGAACCRRCALMDFPAAE